MVDTESDGITLKMVIDHMHIMEFRLNKKIDGGIDSVKGEIRVMRQEIDERLDRLERKVGPLFVQIDNIDKRLDDIEVFQIPKIKRKIGMRR